MAVMKAANMPNIRWATTNTHGVKPCAVAAARQDCQKGRSWTISSGRRGPLN